MEGIPGGYGEFAAACKRLGGLRLTQVKL